MLSSTIDNADIMKAEQHPLVKGFFPKPFQDEYLQVMQDNLQQVRYR